MCLSAEVLDAEPQVSFRPAGVPLPGPAEVHLPSAERTLRCLHSRRVQEADAAEGPDADARGDPEVHQVHREGKVSPVRPSEGTWSSC